VVVAAADPLDSEGRILAKTSATDTNYIYSEIRAASGSTQAVINCYHNGAFANGQ
jgi:hypothetical protein